ncbi:MULTISPECIES: hypothetical protein [Metabacillus]|uniref:hypothetical protein n=1 Tax=Metabacillus TaxID=2675233 RepID=UPI000C800AB7|nr:MULTISPECIES: hypothetical protein [Metabacillus]MCM3443619.1 hypothetical protein [Metabacillus halosaccharovorans]PMC34223.1 hypothetical protein CJ195_24195 [Bacillus sp. UMB0899]
MLTELLWAAESKLSYDRGKSTGLAGLFGIGFVIFCVWKWNDLIYPTLSKLGIVNFADKIGLIYEGAAELSLLRIVGFLIALFLTLLIIWIALMALFIAVCGIVYAVQKYTFLKFLFKYTLVLPLKGILIVVITPLVIIEKVFSSIYRLLNPKGYARRKQQAEQKRIDNIRKSDRELISKIRVLFPEDVSIEEAFLRLNRLPTQGDDNFLIGITKDEKVYILLPSPYYWKEKSISINDSLEDYNYDGNFKEFKQTNEKYYDGLRLEYLDTKKYEYSKEMKVTNTTQNAEYDKVPFSSIEKIYDINAEKRVHFNNQFLVYSRTRAYVEYINYIQKRYLYNLKQLINLSETVDCEQYPHVMKELVKYTASNSDMVSLITTGNTIQWEGDQGEKRRS